MGDRGWVSVVGGRWARRSWPGSDGYSSVRSPSPRAAYVPGNSDSKERRCRTFVSKVPPKVGIRPYVWALAPARCRSCRPRRRKAARCAGARGWQRQEFLRTSPCGSPAERRALPALPYGPTTYPVQPIGFLTWHERTDPMSILQDARSDGMNQIRSKIREFITTNFYRAKSALADGDSLVE